MGRGLRALVYVLWRTLQRAESLTHGAQTGAQSVSPALRKLLIASDTACLPGTGNRLLL